MFPPSGVPLRNEQGVPLPDGPLLTRLRPVPGHPLAALYAPVQPELGAEGGEPPVLPAEWISLHPLACEWASFVQALPALDSCRMAQAFQAVAMGSRRARGTMEQDEQVLDKLNALDQSTLTEREVWQEARERAYAQAAFLLTSGGRQQRASK